MGDESYFDFMARVLNANELHANEISNEQWVLEVLATENRKIKLPNGVKDMNEKDVVTGVTVGETFDVEDVPKDLRSPTAEADGESLTGSNEMGFHDVDEKMDPQTEQLQYFRVVFRDSEDRQIGDVRIPIWAERDEIEQLGENIRTLLTNAIPAVEAIRDQHATAPRPEGARLVIDEETKL